MNCDMLIPSPSDPFAGSGCRQQAVAEVDDGTSRRLNVCGDCLDWLNDNPGTQVRVTGEPAAH